MVAAALDEPAEVDTVPHAESVLTLVRGFVEGGGRVLARGSAAIFGDLVGRRSRAVEVVGAVGGVCCVDLGEGSKGDEEEEGEEEGGELG